MSDTEGIVFADATEAKGGDVIIELEHVDKFFGAFQALADILGRQLASGYDLGASLAVAVDGELVTVGVPRLADTYLYTPTASDNCNVASFTRAISNPSVSPLMIAGTTLGLFPVGSTDVTYTALDDAGLSATCTFTVTVEEGFGQPVEAAQVCLLKDGEMQAVGFTDAS